MSNERIIGRNDRGARGATSSEPYGRFVTRLAATSLALVLGIACGGRATTETQTCEAGTVLQDAQCVAAQQDAEGDVSIGDAPIGKDATDFDTGLVADSPSEGTRDGNAESEAGAADGTADGEADTGDGSDPCPTQLDVDCSQSCSGPDPLCATAACAVPPAFARSPGAPLGPLTIRTPDHPGTSATCVSSCGVGDTRYGFAITYKDALATGFRARVGAPWKIFASSNYCNIALATSGCLAFGTAQGSATFAIVTDDPNAPARNVVIDTYNSLGDGAAPCP
jgi:hypothetical protein